MCAGSPGCARGVARRWPGRASVARGTSAHRARSAQIKFLATARSAGDAKCAANRLSRLGAPSRTKDVLSRFQLVQNEFAKAWGRAGTSRSLPAELRRAPGVVRRQPFFRVLSLEQPLLELA